MAINLSSLFESLQKDRTERYGKGYGVMRQAINLFSPAFTEKMERSTLPAMEASLVGSGLGGIAPKKVSAGMRRGIEDFRISRLADAMSGMAGYIQGGTPTAATLASLATGGFSDMLAKEQLLSRLNQPRSLISGNMFGLGYQPSTDPYQQSLLG